MADVALYFNELQREREKEMNSTKTKEEANMLELSDFLTSPAEVKEGFHGILIGPSGVGKTSTLDDPNFKVLVIDAEGGSAVLQGAPNVQRLDVLDMTKKINEKRVAEKKHVLTRYEVFKIILGGIEAGQFTFKNTGEPFDLYAADSMTIIDEMIKEHIVIREAPTRKREIKDKFSSLGDWGDLGRLWPELLRWVHELTKRGEDSVHFFWLAHSTEVRDELTKTLERTKVSAGSKTGTTADVLQSIVDGYFYMDSATRPTGEKDEKGNDITKLVRYIRTQKYGGFDAKVRQSKRMEALPAVIANPVWSEIFEQLGYHRKSEVTEEVIA